MNERRYRLLEDSLFWLAALCLFVQLLWWARWG